MDLVASLPIVVNILEYVFYTGAASDDIEFNFYDGEMSVDEGLDTSSPV